LIDWQRFLMFLFALRFDAIDLDQTVILQFILTEYFIWFYIQNIFEPIFLRYLLIPLP